MSRENLKCSHGKMLYERCLACEKIDQMQENAVDKLTEAIELIRELYEISQHFYYFGEYDGQKLQQLFTKSDKFLGEVK